MSGHHKKLARHLRNNSSYPEVKLWNHLKAKQLGYDFNRQFRVSGYIVDFYCRKWKVAIEIDGLVHSLRKVNDEKRDSFLTQRGVYVLRFSAQSVLENSDLVASQIKDFIRSIEEQTETEK